MLNLWSINHPRNFWQCQPDFPDAIWQKALEHALPVLGISRLGDDVDSILEWTLGEARFGEHRYRLGLTRRAYYLLKPLIPRALTRWLRSLYNTTRETESATWYIETRFVQFQWETLKQALILSGQTEVSFKYFWAQYKDFAFVLTHDVETAAGQRLIPVLADLEEELGFRSLFNFVPERYPLDRGLMRDLRQRGFEIGLHGLKHDGKLFNSRDEFIRRAARINEYMNEFQAVGFRAPLTHRNPEWMQALQMEYDLSFFDTDPYEPMPGGTMSLHPFTIGNFLELPYTLPQDFTLFNVMGETSPRIWLEKIDLIKQYHGMALVNVHPDYSGNGKSKQIYESFLREIKTRGGYWHALPRDVASWWKNRTRQDDAVSGDNQHMATAVLNNGILDITINRQPVVS